MTQSAQDHLAQFTDEEMAYHEAAHAVVHHLQGGTVTRLSIERQSPQRGAHISPKATWKAPEGGAGALRERIAVLVAGEVGATLYGASPETVAAGGKVDREAALRHAAEAGVDEAAARAMMEEEWARVRALLQEPANWKLLQAAAEKLAREKNVVADLFRPAIVP